MSILILSVSVAAMTALLALFFRTLAAPMKDGETVVAGVMRTAEGLARQLRPYGDDSEDPDCDRPLPETPHETPAKPEDPPAKVELSDAEDDGDVEYEDSPAPKHTPQNDVPSSDPATIAKRIRQRRRSRAAAPKVTTRKRRVALEDVD